MLAPTSAPSFNHIDRDNNTLRDGGEKDGRNLGL
jgi:hypothetical protein